MADWQEGRKYIAASRGGVMTMGTAAEKPKLQTYHDVQLILRDVWTGKEMPALQAAAVAVGQLVGTQVLTFMMAGRRSKGVQSSV